MNSGKSGGATPPEDRSPASTAGRVRWSFDIRETVPNPDEESLQHVYNQFNLMMYICRNVPFGQLFNGPILDIIPRIRASVERAPDRLLSFYEKNDVLGEIRALQQTLENGAESLRLRDLYENLGPAIPPVSDVRQHFQNIKYHVDRACFPFLRLEDPLDEHKITCFVNSLSTWTYNDIYRLRWTLVPNDARPHLRWALENGLVGFHRSSNGGVMRPLVDPEPNNFCCAGSGCAPREGYFCNQDDQGNCTAASDPCPPQD